MTKLLARWVPKLLTLDQKRNQAVISKINLALYEVGPEDLLKIFLTQDKAWVDNFALETKTQ